MPNWASGYIQVKGKPKDVENFCKLFIFEEDEGNKKGKYFARSFVHQSWKDFKKEHLGGSEVGFNVDFAWSCWSCMFEGYPNDKEGCVTLEWAIKKYNVDVTIETEEEGVGFEEVIITKDKKPIYTSENMPLYKCYKCGNEQQIPTSREYDLSNVDCYECEEYGFVDELTELIKEKVKMIEEEKNETNI